MQYFAGLYLLFNDNRLAKVKVYYTIRNPECVVIKGTFDHSGKEKVCMMSISDDHAFEIIRDDPLTYFKEHLGHTERLYPIRLGSVTAKLLEKSHTLDIRTDYPLELSKAFRVDGIKELGKHIEIDDQLKYIIDRVVIV